MDRKQAIKELTLMLLYLTAQPDRDYPQALPRSWKGYDFGVLNELSDDGCIVDGKRSKSVGITEDGERQAKGLLLKYGITE
ncbi:MAG TPA: transposase [Clostridiales bacterium]|nr:transposase [Clostridiales bacterium]